MHTSDILPRLHDSRSHISQRFLPVSPILVIGPQRAFSSAEDAGTYDHNVSSHKDAACAD